MHTPLFVRARVAVLSLVAVLGVALAGLVATAATAAPAGAEAAPSSSPVDAFRAVLEALDRLRTAEADAGCVEAGDSNDVPRVVADIFRCRLLEAGVDEAEAARIATEAVVVSHCESKWDPDAVVFDGRYRDQPHPNGNRYSAAGVFQFIRRTADIWIDGGYGQVTDPRRNIDAAARLFISNRARGYGGWGDWACVAANDGFRATSVLPGWPGGPAALPEWASRYVP